MSQIGKYSGGLAGIPISTIEGNAGGQVPPNILGELILLGTDPITVTGNPATSTLTITVAAASEIQTGVLELATDAEAIGGMDTVRAIVPSSLKAKLGAQTLNTIPYGNTDFGAISWTAAGTDGQLVIAATGAAPAFASLISTSGFITFTPGANTLDLNPHGSVAVSFDGDAGTATPALGVLNIVGTAGANITTAGALSTISIGISGTTQHAVQVGNAAGSLTSLAAATNGQLIIGSTGVDPVLATLTAGIGVGITNAAGAITINAAGVDQNSIIYVGKHGNDGNDGLTIDKAFLTFGAAITAAFAIAPAVIVCFDEGIYTEDLTGLVDVHIDAANATIAGAHTLAAGNHWKFDVATVAAGAIGFTFNSAGSDAFLSLYEAIGTGTGICFASLGGDFQILCEEITVDTGFVVGSTTSDYIRVKSMKTTITGAGYCVGVTSGGKVCYSGNCIVDDTGTGTLAFSAGGATAGVGFNVGLIDMATLSNITATTTLRIVATSMTGTLNEVGAGAASSIISGPGIDGVPIGADTPSTGAFTTLSATTPIAVPSGGSGAATFTDHGVLLGSGVGAFTATAVGATNTVLHGNTGADPTYSAVDMAADVTGILPVANGGTGFATTTAYAVLCGGTTATGAFQPVAGVGNAGQVLTSNGAAALPTFQAAGGGGISFTEVTGTTQALAVNSGYILNNGALVTATLPASATVGDVIRVIGLGAGGFQIAQNASQYIRWDENVVTTTGVGGSLDSTDDHDAVELICTVTDNGWGILSSKGNLSYT